VAVGFTMPALTDELLARLADAPAVLVRVERTEGSVPREAGAWMAVFGDAVIGTIGGGHLEFDAIAQARGHLRHAARPGSAPPVWRARQALGPSLGQCCGGVVHLAFEPLAPLVAGPADGAAPSGPAADLVRRLSPPLHPVALFGGGHVGHALVQALAPLPFAITWVDSREGVFPPAVPASVRCEPSDPVQGAVPGLAPGSRVLIMSFSHAEDLDIVAACLQRLRQQDDLPFIGLIGSRTKWATFRHRLEARGYTPDELARITCPIGLPGLAGKEPAVIAASVAAQLLLQRSAA
jgi:xanthine dehydrogenase accessory factor